MALSTLGTRLLRRTFRRLPEPAALRLYGMWHARTLRASLHPVHDSVDATVDGRLNVQMLLGTKTGILLYAHGRLTRILRGRFYGISRRGDRWYAYKYETQRFGRIISFRLAGLQCVEVKDELCQLPGEVHQIDWAGSCLYVTDTQHNCVRRYAYRGSQLVCIDRCYPNGTLAFGRRSPNYAHINSVFCDGDRLFIVYHNETKKTGRKSQVAILDLDLRLQNVVSLDAGCAHNVLPIESDIAFCDSMNGAVRLGSRSLSLGLYTRGLAKSGSVLFVGGSDFAARAQRGQSTGHVFTWDCISGQVYSHLTMPQIGSVYEVRLVEPTDEALSVCL